MDGGVLLIEVGHVWYKVLDHVHVWKGVHLDGLAGGGVNLAARTEKDRWEESHREALYG